MSPGEINGLVELQNVQRCDSRPPIKAGKKLKNKLFIILYVRVPIYVRGTRSYGVIIHTRIIAV